MEIQIGEVQFNEALLLVQLRNDLKDDWFPDPLRYRDMLSGGVLSSLIASNVAAHHGRYSATKSELYNLPKPNFTLRYTLETGLGDRAIYHGLVSYIVPFFDKIIPWNVFSHRQDRIHPASKHMFRRAVPAWRDFIGAVRSAIGSDSFLVSTDVSNYYENISLKRLNTTLEALIPALEASVEHKSKIRSHIELLFRLLDCWAYEQMRGLPQNRDASSFLANIYMHPVDCVMRERGFENTYFRYMDDIKIVCKDEFEARRALKILSLALREIGLSLNSKKTDIIPGADVDKLKQHLDEGSSDVQYLDTLWRTRARETILRSIPKLKDLTLKLIGCSKTDSKDFRYCIGRIEDLALCDDFAVPREFFRDITPSIIDSVGRVPASTDLFARYLIAVPVESSDLLTIAEHLLHPGKTLYSWQNYVLWCLLAHKHYRSAELLTHVRALISDCGDNATRAGATVYGGAIGDAPTRKLIAEKFQNLRSFMGQRCALIAVHELPFQPTIKSAIKPYVRADLRGIYAALHERPGRYFAPPEARPITKFVDLDRDYE